MVGRYSKIEIEILVLRLKLIEAEQLKIVAKYRKRISRPKRVSSALWYLLWSRGGERQIV